MVKMKICKWVKDIWLFLRTWSDGKNGVWQIWQGLLVAIENTLIFLL
jgi:hypothetical protein